MAKSTEGNVKTPIQQLNDYLTNVKNDDNHTAMLEDKKMLIGFVEKAIKDEEKKLQMVVYEPPFNEKEIQSEIQKLLGSGKMVINNPYVSLQNAVTKSLKNSFEKPYDNIVANLNKVSKDIKKEIKAVKKVKFQLDNIVDETEKIFEGAMVVFEGKKGEIANNFTQQLMDVSGNESKNESKIKKFADTIVSSIFRTIENKVDRVRNGIKEVFELTEKIINAINNSINKGKESVENTIDKGKNKIRKEIGKQLTKIIENINVNAPASSSSHSNTRTLTSTHMIENKSGDPKVESSTSKNKENKSELDKIKENLTQTSKEKLDKPAQRHSWTAGVMDKNKDQDKRRSR